MKALILHTQMLRRRGMSKLTRFRRKKAAAEGPLAPNEKAELSYSKPSVYHSPSARKPRDKYPEKVPEFEESPPHPSPPSYHECVKKEGFKVSAIIDKKDHVIVVTEREVPETKEAPASKQTQSRDSGQRAPPAAAPPIQAETIRGRRPEILYRSQLHDLALRKSVSRPSPNRLRYRRSAPKTSSHAAVVETQAACLQWHKDYRVLQVTALCFSLLCLIICAF